jgi:hypothetical protein
MPRHVVVDGSNLATEGRTLPSLKQLNEAVLAYMQDHPDDLITVVVDATFGHRIAPSEVPEFDAAIENNELVCPPAGAIGRGDAFVLSIANKAGAIILSNDSFQEFHGDHPWLFDEGRLVGGKPVPHIGWVFVNRAPVRGPTSRKAVRDAKKGGGRRGEREPRRAASRPSKVASEPMPVPKTPPPVRKPAAAAVAPAAARAAEPTRPRHDGDKGRKQTKPAEPARHVHAPAPAKHDAINDLLPFLGFVESHPVGSPVEATVESYSSHGAYAMAGDVRCYAPLRFLGDPAPRSAREVLAMGQTATFVVVSFNPARRGIDVALPGFQPAEIVLVDAAPVAAAKPARKSRAKAVAPPPDVTEAPPLGVTSPPAPASKRGRKAPAGDGDGALVPAAVAAGGGDLSPAVVAVFPAPAKRRGSKKAVSVEGVASDAPADGPTDPFAAAFADRAGEAAADPVAAGAAAAADPGAPTPKAPRKSRRGAKGATAPGDGVPAVDTASTVVSETPASARKAHKAGGAKAQSRKSLAATTPAAKARGAKTPADAVPTAKAPAAKASAVKAPAANGPAVKAAAVKAAAVKAPAVKAPAVKAPAKGPAVKAPAAKAPAPKARGSRASTVAASAGATAEPAPVPPSGRRRAAAPVPSVSSVKKARAATSTSPESTATKTGPARSAKAVAPAADVASAKGSSRRPKAAPGPTAPPAKAASTEKRQRSPKASPTP